MNKECIICIDAGGTKSKASAYTLDGQILATFTTGSGSPAAVKDQAWANIDCAMEQVRKMLPQDTTIRFIQMGISGVGVVANIKEMEQQFSVKYYAPCNIQNDAIIALYSIIKDQYESGILVLAGTGSAIYGTNGTETQLIGGWGHIIRERGSAYAAVHQACLKVIDQVECGEPLNPFHQLWLKRLHISDINQLKPLFYQHTKDEIASHVVYIKELADNGDESARAILSEEGRALAAQVILLVHKMKLPSHTVFGVRGGFIQKGNQFIMKGFFEELSHQKVTLTFIEDDVEPIIGAYYLAKRNMQGAA